MFILKRIKYVQKRTDTSRPRTRSRANNRSLGDKDAVDAIDKGKRVASATEKEVPSAATARGKLVKPTCSKLLKKGDNSVPSGSVAAYIALRERQKLNLEADLRREDDGDTILSSASEGEQVEAGNACVRPLLFFCLIVYASFTNN